MNMKETGACKLTVAHLSWAETVAGQTVKDWCAGEEKEAKVLKNV